jgi:hypothetical protein
VSLTAAPRDTAAQFVKTHAIPWPCMYDVPDETLTALGASGRAAGIRKAFPTLYVIGRDGRVAWSDQRARYQHQPVTAWATDVEQALDEALKTK